MISTLLVAAPWLAFTVLIAVIVLAPVVGLVLAARPRVTTVLLVAALLAVAGLTLFPEGERASGVACAVELPYLAPTASESIANILLFVPVAFLAGLRWRRPAAAILASIALSVLIELLQAAVPAIGRACDTSDGITNSIGALIGGLLAAVALAWHRRATRSGSETRAGHGRVR